MISSHILSVEFMVTVYTAHQRDVFFIQAVFRISPLTESVCEGPNFGTIYNTATYLTPIQSSLISARLQNCMKKSYLTSSFLDSCGFLFSHFFHWRSFEWFFLHFLSFYHFFLDFLFLLFSFPFDESSLLFPVRRWHRSDIFIKPSHILKIKIVSPSFFGGFSFFHSERSFEFSEFRKLLDSLFPF